MQNVVSTLARGPRCLRCAHFVLSCRGCREFTRDLQSICTEIHQEVAVVNLNTRFCHRQCVARSTELWIWILREASALTSDPLVTSQELSFMEEERPEACQLEAYHVNMRNKHNLVLVSHQ
jgi:hypothetical protein